MAVVFSNSSLTAAQTVLPDADITTGMFNTAKTIAEGFYNNALTSRGGNDPYSEAYRNNIGTYLIAHFAYLTKSDIMETRVLDLTVKYARSVSAVGLNRTKYGKTVVDLDFEGLLQTTTSTMAGFL